MRDRDHRRADLPAAARHACREPKPILESDVNHVLDTDGNEIAVFKHFETYIKVEPSDIPQVMKDAVVTAEDKHFYDHGGVDVGSTLRALWDDIQNRAAVQGGSTITQQYVKNAFTTGERTLARKVREAILASQLERAREQGDDPVRLPLDDLLR